ncbi:hypothetical protein ACIBEJ_24420 [Nonomuraea sp. NPDC050790]|uniref:hypothetical protein n=1 Tax=Nonomuraea sp. NPDC050790 TaxID=3364371 RepID=UPI0037A0AE28
MTETQTKQLPTSTPLTTEDAQRVVDQISADVELAGQVAEQLDRDPRLLFVRLFALAPAQQTGLSRMRLDRTRSTFAPVARALREGDPIAVRIIDVPAVASAFSCSFSVKVDSDGVAVEGSITT